MQPTNQPPNGPAATMQPSTRTKHKTHSITTVIILILIVFIAVVFVGWQWSSLNAEDRRVTQTVRTSEVVPATTLQDTQVNMLPVAANADADPIANNSIEVPGSDEAIVVPANGEPVIKEKGFSGMIQSFFGGILNMVQSFTGATFGEESMYANPPGRVAPIEPMTNNVNNVVPARETFNGKILDFEGNIAGDIEAIEQSTEGKPATFDFTLKQGLTPSDKARRYSVPQDEVKVVQEEDMFYIQLNEEQTRALAETLYEEE